MDRQPLQGGLLGEPHNEREFYLLTWCTCVVVTQRRSEQSAVLLLAGGQCSGSRQ